MAATRRPGGVGSELDEALVRAGRPLRRGVVSADMRTLEKAGGREADRFYRDRWSYDKVVRSTHGVNCTGSCSWKVYVKDGIITWESQQTDYPSAGPDRPDYEPRGCPRGAAFSWYTYSPTRVRYPYVRGVLLEEFRAAKARNGGDPVEAWAEITGNPDLAGRYKSARGKGGFVRATWDEAVELAAAAHVHTIRTWGPDRIAGFSPIPAMSMVSHAAGARFHALIGAPLLSFYDWYADLPVASPQVFGDQTDVPESGDWWDASYLVLWGSNVPVTRTPDAHWMTEARYRGQKVVVCSPDYSDATKFADEWLSPAPGTDGALAMAMGHVILREFFVDHQVPNFTNYVTRFTDAPFLVTLEQSEGAARPGKFLTAVALGGRTQRPVAPGGSLGFRFGDAGLGRWNLDLGDIEPVLTLWGGAAGPGLAEGGAAGAGARGPGLAEGGASETVAVDLPRFDARGGGAGQIRRGVPARRIGGHLVTTVFDLLLAQYGVGREGLPGEWPSGYADSGQPCTPAWQESITGVPAAAAERIGREFAQNAEDSGGRSMIIMGAGTNHYFHSDTIYRAFLALVTLTGCQGRNGGGWAHYVGQEKVRPITGHVTLAMATDWQRPPRQMIGTAYWYLATDQWRYDTFAADAFAAPAGRSAFAGLTIADLIAQSARLGWMPSYPTFNWNPLDLADAVARAGEEPGTFVAGELAAGRLRFAAEDPDAPENYPRVLTVWRANLLGSSGKGNEYFLKHLLGAASSVRAGEAPPGQRPRDVVWREQAADGKLDLLLALDFRMTSTTLFADVVLPAATWYEKHDLSSTDMHPFVHAFSPAISPPWETRTDFDAFHAIAARFSELSASHLGVRRDLVATPLLHDTPDELATPHGTVRDWKTDGGPPVPAGNFPRLTLVERDYPNVAAQLASLGPLADRLGA